VVITIDPIKDRNEGTNAFAGKGNFDVVGYLVEVDDDGEILHTSTPNTIVGFTQYGTAANVWVLLFHFIPKGLYRLRVRGNNHQCKKQEHDMADGAFSKMFQVN